MPARPIRSTLPRKTIAASSVAVAILIASAGCSSDNRGMDHRRADSRGMDDSGMDNRSNRSSSSYGMSDSQFVANRQSSTNYQPSINSDSSTNSRPTGSSYPYANSQAAAFSQPSSNYQPSNNSQPSSNYQPSTTSSSSTYSQSTDSRPSSNNSPAPRNQLSTSQSSSSPQSTTNYQPGTDKRGTPKDKGMDHATRDGTNRSMDKGMNNGMDNTMLGASRSGPQGEKMVNSIIAQWAERPRLGATEMIAKYGQPQEATSERLIWHNPGPFKRIMVLNLETPHDFPIPHVDFLEHTIVYNVPQEKVGDLIAFDASSTINRTVGELSARCDLEGHNVLTLNLDHDIVTGKKTVAQARQAFGEIVGKDVKGEHPPYVEALQFTATDKARAAFPDTSVVPGAPQRAAAMGDMPARSDSTSGDAQAFASIIAIDLNEVLAAAAAQQKKISQPVKDFAKMMQEAHGAHMVDTMQLAQRLGVTPINTPSVEKIQKDGAGELGKLIPLDGEPFASAYLDAMVKCHTDVLGMLDSTLIPAASSDQLKGQLTKTRADIAAHLETAKALRRPKTP